MAKRGPKEMSPIREDGDPYKVLKDAYHYGRAFPRGDGPNPHDNRRLPRAPHRMSRTPEMDEYRASYAPVKDAPVSQPDDESGPTMKDSKASHLNDCANTWVRGYDLAPHFDHGPSGHRYGRK